MQPIKLIITKEDGNTEEFLPAKLQQSLLKSGAEPTMADKILRTIVEDLQKGVCDPETGGGTCSVRQIYDKAFSMLKEMSVSAAARYSLRRSIMEFGPTGFPFEEYVAEIYKAKGFETLTDQMVLGTCVPHEVDLIAWNPHKLIMAEIKYHNEQAGKTDLKAALYVKARYDDIKDNTYQYGKELAKKIDEWWLITNTKFTDIAEKYAKCVGLNIMSWSYPAQGNLLDLIEETKLHPVTCLTSLTASDKRELIDRDIVLCKSIYNNRHVLKELGYSDEKVFKVMEEISQIINLVVPKN